MTYIYQVVVHVHQDCYTYIKIRHINIKGHIYVLNDATLTCTASGSYNKCYKRVGFCAKNQDMKTFAVTSTYVVHKRHRNKSNELKVMTQCFLLVIALNVYIYVSF